MRMRLRAVGNSGAETAAGDRAPRRILVAFDGSRGAWAGLRQAIEIATRERSLLTIVAVVPEPSLWATSGLVSVPYTCESLRRESQCAMERALAAARDAVPDTVSVTTRLVRGRPARALGRLVAAGDYDLVVTGPRRAGRLRALLGGRVTRALRSRSRGSGLVVRPG